MAAGSLDDVRRELYALAPGQFVPRRAELARAVKGAGDRAGAQAILALRKPSKSASLLNRLAAARPEKITELLELGSDFRSAQGDPDPDRLFGLTLRRRRLVTELAALAGTVAGTAATPAVHEEMVGTLNAATADESAGARLARGELEAAIEWSGLGAGFGGVPADGPTLRLLPGGRTTGSQPRRSTAGAGTPDCTADGEATQADQAEDADESTPAEPSVADRTATERAAAVQAATERAAAERAGAERAVAEARRTAARQRAAEAERAARTRVDQLESSVQRLTARLRRETAGLDDARVALQRARADVRAVSEPPPAGEPDPAPARSEP